MFDCHQVEITVMQFSGHSLPVYQSMSVSWDFLPCLISSAKHAYAISSHKCHQNVSLLSGASLCNGKFGRVEGQNTTVVIGKGAFGSPSKMVDNFTYMRLRKVWSLRNFFSLGVGYLTPLVRITPS